MIYRNTAIFMRGGSKGNLLYKRSGANVATYLLLPHENAGQKKQLSLLPPHGIILFFGAGDALNSKK